MHSASKNPAVQVPAQELGSLYSFVKTGQATTICNNLSKSVSVVSRSLMVIIKLGL